MAVDRQTDEQVYQEQAFDLLRFAMGLVGRNDAADVVSEAVLCALSSKSWASVADRRAYLYQAVLNRAKNHHRDRQRRWAGELRTVGMDPTDPPEYQPEVLAAVRTLSIRQRAVVVLTYWDGLTPAQVAARLAVSEGSVRRHLARARSRLRGMLDE